MTMMNGNNNPNMWIKEWQNGVKVSDLVEELSKLDGNMEVMLGSSLEGGMKLNGIDVEEVTELDDTKRQVCFIKYPHYPGA